ncbi:MAG: WD40-repeat-containing domain protein [Olpidium bornovanus]|uniref:U three protein 7 n=1 Tax=Olpidium bornovanus TaxID=278681 RepID=A0A8H8DJ01_9FUNG|nr:MAG: WD40-repeat-containing domain protein [Olpidium bornovanus]
MSKKRSKDQQPRGSPAAPDDSARKRPRRSSSTAAGAPRSAKGTAPSRRPAAQNEAKPAEKKGRIEQPELSAEVLGRLPKYARGQGNSTKKVTDKKLKANLNKAEVRFDDAAKRAARAEVLLTEEAGFLEAEGMERTYKFTQKQLSEHLDVGTKKKLLNLRLDTFGPYNLDFTRNGRHMLVAGRKGHVATFDWHMGRLASEIQLKETVRDAVWLHNEMYHAVAQKKYVYIYDHRGAEIHCLKKHIEVNKMQFLPYHFLLASVGNAGYLKYQDTSTGQLVAEHRTRLGRCDTMTQNPTNAIIHLGHANGTVTLWSPSVSTPLVKMLTHKGPVNAVAVDLSGKYMVTSGFDGNLNIWDLRTYKQLQYYFTPTPAACLSISQRGLLAVAYGPNISVWKEPFRTKQLSPYMSHLQPGTRVEDMHFCPFEDVLGFGHSSGVSTIVVPGAGEPNFDALEANPFQTARQRQEAEVKALLDKIQPEMITLDPNLVGKVVEEAKPVPQAEKRKR